MSTKFMLFFSLKDYKIEYQDMNETGEFTQNLNIIFKLRNIYDFINRSFCFSLKKQKLLPSLQTMSACKVSITSHYLNSFPI